MNERPDTISVIMSVYNEREDWLRAAIESILGQTHRELEFIILLDNPGNTALEAVIREYAARDERIVFLKNDRNRGLVYSLNRGLEAASGIFIARMDADDISEPTRLETELRILREESLDLVAGNLLYIDEEGVLQSDPEHPPYCFGRTPEACLRLLRIRNFMPHPTWLVRAEAFRIVGPYHDIPRTEDYEWLCRAASHGLRMRKIETPMLRYRRRRSSISVSGAYFQRRVTCLIAREYRRALRRRRELDPAALERAIARIDPEQDNAPYEEAKAMYADAWSVMRKAPLAGILGILRAFRLCPFLLRTVWDDRQMDRVDRKFAPPPSEV